MRIDVLRAQYENLKTSLDARAAAMHLYQRNALTLKELQKIQRLTDCPVEAAEKLLDMIMEQPDAVYLCFLDVLKDTHQQHIYIRDWSKVDIQVINFLYNLTILVQLKVFKSLKVLHRLQTEKAVYE